MQINDAAHGQSRQVRDEYALGTGDGHWKRPDGGRLIDDEQESTMSLEFGDEGAQLGLKCSGVILAFTDVDEVFDGMHLAAGWESCWAWLAKAPIIRA